MLLKTIAEKTFSVFLFHLLKIYLCKRRKVSDGRSIRVNTIEKISPKEKTMIITPDKDSFGHNDLQTKKAFLSLCLSSTVNQTILSH